MEDVKLFDEDVVGDGSGGENLGDGNVKKQGEHGGEGALKRRALEGVVAKGGAGGEQAVMLDDGPGAVWNINKVKYYVPTPGVPSKQEFWAHNGDDKLVLSLDGNTVTSAAGYRMARAAYGISEGGCYFEVTAPSRSGGAIRFGWSDPRGDPEATVGYDEYGYGMRDKDGYKFHGSRGRPYGSPAHGGDILGAFIYLPPKPNDEPEPQPPPHEAPIAEIVAETADFWSVRIISGQEFSLPTSETIPVVRKGAYISFFLNGKPLGTAFQDIYAGTYYPSVSPYRCSVTANFGPTFRFPPEGLSQAWVAASELVIKVPPATTTTTATAATDIKKEEPIKSEK